MRLNLRLISLPRCLTLFVINIIIFIVFFGLISTKSAYANTVTLSGIVQDSSGTPIASASVSVNDANSDKTITNSSGNYSLSIPSGTYNVSVTPPSGSNYSSAIALSQNIPFVK